MLTPLLVALLLPIGALTEAAEVPFHLPTPEGWRTETIPFPLEFAPELDYEGVEELRFAPGMFTEGAEDYWTYAFVWWLPSDVALGPEQAGPRPRDLLPWPLARRRGVPRLHARRRRGHGDARAGRGLGAPCRYRDDPRRLRDATGRQAQRRDRGARLRRPHRLVLPALTAAAQPPRLARPRRDRAGLALSSFLKKSEKSVAGEDTCPRPGIQAASGPAATHAKVAISQQALTSSRTYAAQRDAGRWQTPCSLSSAGAGSGPRRTT